MKPAVAAALVLGLAACAGAPKRASEPAPLAGTAAVSQEALQPGQCDGSPYAPAQEDPATRGDYVAGGLYKPGVADTTPAHVPDVACIPEPQVVDLPRSKVGNRASYAVLGRTYRVMDDQRGYVEQGRASYYGNKFHGRRTSNLEVYDMYAFTAAHKTLPLPSFARVTNLDNGKSVVVRVNDRGPFHEGRVIDLSYAAAVKLDFVRHGTARVEVRALTPQDAGTVLAATPARPPAATGAAATGMDRLVATIPVGAAGAIELPPGVRVATGRPASMAQPSADTGTAPATAGVQVPAPAVAQPLPPDYRFDMRQDGRAMTADEFDAWMRTRQVRVATGQPGTPVSAVAASQQGATPGAGHTLPPTRLAAPAAMPAPAPAPAPAAGGVTLQVAAFSARGNADRALAMLRGAGVDGAHVLDGLSAGRPVWRLRIGPLAASAVPALSARIAGLGFGPPQRVVD
ncbi:septal ring lytic transglycosylase RlpA family protein [Lysobacter sp. A3-1-A15]|uniref:septal ring lytic transglycosylase RlpA family protein n=1 Tax=Novilysobacter viscosus TaxID=3098602 RepID=UPI002EDA528B